MIYNQAIETMPLEQLRQLQDERLRTLVARLYRDVPFYQTRLQEAGLEPRDIRGIADLAKLPITTKEDLRQHYPFLCLPNRWGRCGVFMPPVVLPANQR